MSKVTPNHSSKKCVIKQNMKHFDGHEGPSGIEV